MSVGVSVGVGGCVGGCDCAARSVVALEDCTVVLARDMAFLLLFVPRLLGSCVGVGVCGACCCVVLCCDAPAPRPVPGTICDGCSAVRWQPSQTFEAHHQIPTCCAIQRYRHSHRHRHSHVFNHHLHSSITFAEEEAVWVTTLRALFLFFFFFRLLLCLVSASVVCHHAKARAKV